MNSPTDPASDSLSVRVANSFAPPQVLELDDWRLIRHLGSGSTAHVWLMQHTSRAQYAACKTPKTHQDALTLSQEAQLAGSLRHENLIAPMERSPDMSSAGATFWEFLPAGSLANLIASTGKLSVAKTVTILSPMLQVAQYLHDQLIVHGDISPRNVLFDLTGRPVLIDLGASRATAHSYTITGTPGFVAPEVTGTQEQVEGLGSAADVYSLGAVGWFCLTGTIPGPTHARVPLVTLNADLDTEVVQLLEASLSAEPALRPSLEQLAGAVPYWAEPEAVDLYPAVSEEYELHLPTRKPMAATPARRKFQRHRIYLGFGALALAGGVAVTAMYGNPTIEQHTVDLSASEHAESNQDIDFQAIMDTLAKSRSAAWASSDASRVGDYATSESDIYAEDHAVLESLTSAAHTLDGMRMRTVVKAVERTGEEEAAVSVEWRTDGYVQRDASGEVVEEFAHRVVPIDLTLRDTAEGWKIAEVAGQ